ncbi:hypothetical protein ABZ667_39995 [Streptomyces lavendulae]|uniref:hypothetical protein n=1 Tax=Streptomyces lavendulae TaxID=1914 RepID=UPI0033F0F221
MTTPTPTPTTEFAFELPHGHLDAHGTLHRRGIMRMATARDELACGNDLRVRENPAYLGVVLLSQVVTRLGSLSDIHAGVIESLLVGDLAHLQDMYERINAPSFSEDTCCLTCGGPRSGGDGRSAGDRLGES